MDVGFNSLSVLSATAIFFLFSFFSPSPWGGFQTSAEPNLSPPSNWGQIADVLSVGGQGASSDSRPPFLQIISFSGRIKLSPGGAGTVQGDRGQLSLRRGTLPTPHPLEKERESEREGGGKNALQTLWEIRRPSLSGVEFRSKVFAVGLLRGSPHPPPPLCAALGP